MFTESTRIKEWKFRSNKVTSQRLHSLEQDLPFSVIAKRIADEMTDIKFSSENGNREARSKKRARFFFKVTFETVDIFFNSSQGYRAQYYIDTQRGIDRNRLVINMIKNKLIEAARQTSQEVITIEQVKKSIEYESVKIWIDEEKSTLNQTSRDPQEIQALEVPRWVSAMNQVLAAWDAGEHPDPTTKIRSLLGVQAPEGCHLKVLGAWLDDNDREYVVPSKRNRAQEIHEYGFS